MSQILKRRVLELRRLIAKDKSRIIDVLDFVALYSAVAAKDNARAGHLGPFGTWSPALHHPEGTDVQYGMKDYPSPAIHPSSGQAGAFEPSVDASGPIGLLLQSIARIGASIDNEHNSTQ